MLRVGTRHATPDPSERPSVAQRWLLRLGGAVLVASAAILLLRWLSDRSGDSGETAVSPHPQASQVSAPDEAGSAREPARDATSAARAASAGDAEFSEQLERLATRRLLNGTPYTADVTQLVAAKRIGEAVTLLEARAASGDRDANVVLAQLHANCASQTSAPSSPNGLALLRRQVEVAQVRSAPVPARVARRIAVSLEFAQREFDWLARACSEARFDAGAIDQRLRDAAQTGHEASLWALGAGTEDAELRKKYWLSAAMLGHPGAQSALATSLLGENLRGDRRNRGQMNFWLETAAKHSAGAKLMLGECLLNGCNAQPPDAEAAASLLRDAATLGELGAFQALTSISRGDPAAPSDAELYALQSFLQQLNEIGCYGALLYPSTALDGLRSAREIASRLSPHALEQAQNLAAATWRDHGESARRAQGCD